jgi:hypothetical protein
MADEYARRRRTSIRRQSHASTASITQIESHHRDRRGTTVGLMRRYSTVATMLLPHETEYHQQPRAPAHGIEIPMPSLLETSSDNLMATVSATYDPSSEQFVDDSSEAYNYTLLRTLLFIFEPVFTGFILLPMIAMFWVTGINLFVILLTEVNQRLFEHDIELSDDALPVTSYSTTTLWVSYSIVQLLLLICHLSQDQLYQCTISTHWLLKIVLVKWNILFLSILYIVEWQTTWTMLDQFFPSTLEWQVMFSTAALLAIIVLHGHLADLICAPFLMSYDSVEYCIQFGCSLLTREVSDQL